MKRLFATLLLALCWSLQPLSSSAATWVHLYDIGYEGSVSLDADSFSYDHEKDTVHLWQKIVSEGDNSVLELEYSYNLGEQTVALLGEGFYQPGEAPSYQRYTQISYQPISQGSYAENTFYFLQLVDFLEKNNINWEFNRTTIPKHSSLDSSDWEMGAPNFVYDTGTAYSDKDKESYWTYGEDRLDYIELNKADESFAVLAQRFMQNGDIVLGFNYPLAIWSNPQGQMTEAHQQAMQAQAVILNGIFESYVSLNAE